MGNFVVLFVKLPIGVLYQKLVNGIKEVALLAAMESASRVAICLTISRGSE
jgi:hypothetical protein